MPSQRQARPLGPCLFLLAMTVFQGCGKSLSTTSVDIGTSAMVQLSDRDAPLLTKELLDRIQLGMGQVEALQLIQDAGRLKGQANSSLNLASEQATINPVRYHLVLQQGKRKLDLEFKSEKLEKKTAEGID